PPKAAAEPTKPAATAAEPTKPAAAAATKPAEATKPAAAVAAPTNTPAAAAKPAEATKPAEAAKPAAGPPGTPKLPYWQAPTVLNLHVATGTKDQHASRVFLEPLLTYTPKGDLIPVLAAEVPSKANGGLSEDGKSVTYKLKPGLKWA